MTKKILTFFGEIIGMSVFLWLMYALACIGYNFKPSSKPMIILVWIFFTILLARVIVRIFKKKIIKNI